MSTIVADGSILSIASTYGTSVVMSAITNATEAVATLGAGHAVVVGDFLEVSSAWPDLDGKILRVKTVATNDVTLEGFNTTDVTKFPAAGGAGTIKRITAWANLGQITDIDTTGGDQQYYQFQYLNQLQSQQVPIGKSPIVMSLMMADDITLAQMAILRTAEQSGSPKGMRIVFRNATRTLANGYWSMAYMPKIKIGEANKRAIGFSLSALPQEYST